MVFIIDLFIQKKDSINCKVFQKQYYYEYKVIAKIIDVKVSLKACLIL
jgi:hypothetical protein